MLKFKFDKDKAIAAVLYVCHELLRTGQRTDLHRIFKILYFADQKHLARYGRPIVGDQYVAMEHGPVPSNIYDILKAVRGDSFFFSPDEFKKCFEIKFQKYVKPKAAPDMDEFSESDLECINESLKENKDLSFKELKSKSHDAPYIKASKADKISFREMAKRGGATKEILSYLAAVSENESTLDS